MKAIYYNDAKQCYSNKGSGHFFKVKNSLDGKFLSCFFFAAAALLCEVWVYAYYVFVYEYIWCFDQRYFLGWSILALIPCMVTLANTHTGLGVRVVIVSSFFPPFSLRVCVCVSLM